jgi:hypothetical protein
VKLHYGKFLIATLALISVSLLAQNPAPIPPYSDQADLSKVEEWVLSQGNVASIAAELAAILGLGSERLPVKLKSFRTSNGISRALAVSTKSSQKGMVLSALKTMDINMKVYSLGTAWLTDRTGVLHRTIAIDASGARIISNSSHAAEFNDIKAFFIRKFNAANPSISSSRSSGVSTIQPLQGKKKPGGKSSNQ